MQQISTNWFNKRGYLQGVFFLSIMMVVSCFNDIITRFIGSRIPPLEILFFRFFFCLLTLIPFMIHKGSDVFKTKRITFHIIRGVLGFSSFALFIYSVVHIKLVDVVTIFWSIPLFVLIFSRIFLKEQVTLLRWIATIIGFIGLAVITMSESTEAISLKPIYLLPITSAMLFSIQDVMVKKVVDDEKYITMLFYFALIATMLSFFPMMSVWIKPTAKEIILMSFLGIGGNLMQYFIFKAFSATDLSALSPVRYLEFLLISIFGFIFFQELPAANVLIGAAILIPTTLYLSWNEAKKPKSPQLPISNG